MSKISCDVCLDLMPLVKDGIASEDSQNLVLEHINTCNSCREIYGEQGYINTGIDDKKIIGNIKKNMLFFIITIVFFGVSVGLMITDSMNMFYNALIMPAIGGFGYMFLKNKAYYSTIIVFTFTSLHSLITGIMDGYLSHEGGFAGLLMQMFFYSIIYTAFSIIGIIIAWAFNYAFKKGE